MARVYLKIQTTLGKERSVRDQLRKIRGVVMADLVTGEDDLMAVVEGKDLQRVLDLVIRRAEGRFSTHLPGEDKQGHSVLVYSGRYEVFEFDLFLPPFLERR